MGTVVAVGAGVTEFRVGDTVLAPTPHASIAIVKAAAAAKVPRGTGSGASLFMMAVIAYHGVHLARVQRGERVAVIGRGIIGQFAAQISCQYDPKSVASIARTEAFIGESLRRTCEEVVVLSESAPSGEYDVTFEVTGSPQALRTAVENTRVGGRIVLLGSTRGIVEGVDFAEIGRKQLTLVGAHTATLTTCAQSGVYDPTLVTRRVAQAIVEGTIDADGLVDRVITPEEAPQYYLRMADDRYRALGLVIDWTQLDRKSRLGRVGWFQRPSLTSGTSRLASAAPQTRPRSAVRVADPPVGIAMLGCGAQGRLNAADVVAADGARLVGVMDPDRRLAERLASSLGVQAWTSMDEVLTSPSVEALFLVTPHHLHLPQVESAAAYGKHVLVEKPVSANYADAVRLVEVGEERELRIATWLGCRYLPAYVEAKRLCDAGALGDFRGGTLSFQLYKPLSYYQVSGWRARRETAGGGVLIMNAIHYLDVFLWLVGEPVEEVFASYSSLAEPSSDVEDSIGITIRFKNGAVATVHASSCAMGMSQTGPEMRIFGRDGSMQLGHPNQVYTVQAGTGYDPGKWQPLSGLPQMKSMGIEVVERFASGVRWGTSFDVSGRDGLVVQAVIEAAYRSFMERRPVTIAELETTK